MIPIPALASRAFAWIAADLQRAAWILVGLLFVACASQWGMLAIRSSKIDTLTAELNTKDAQCNQRVLDDIAGAERAAKEATVAAIRAERIRWQEQLDANRQAVREAQSGRELEAERARELEAELAAIYRSDPDAEEWRTTRIPDAIRRRLRE